PRPRGGCRVTPPGAAMSGERASSRACWAVSRSRIRSSVRSAWRRRRSRIPRRRSCTSACSESYSDEPAEPLHLFPPPHHACYLGGWFLPLPGPSTRLVKRVVSVPATLDDRAFDALVAEIAGPNGGPVEGEPEELLFDARHVRWADPYGMTGLLAIGAQLR